MAKPASGGRVIETVVVAAAAAVEAAAHFKCKCVCGVNAVLQNILYSRADTDRARGSEREREREGQTVHKICWIYILKTFGRGEKGGQLLQWNASFVGLKMRF